MDETLASLGFTRSPLEHAVYRCGNAQCYLLVVVYVDNLIITGTNGANILSFKNQMQQLFKMSDLGLLSYYLGIEVEQNSSGITLSQKRYAKKIFEIANMGNVNGFHTPMECCLKLKKHDSGEPFDADTSPTYL